MKAIILCLALIATVNSQDILDTTADLLAAQRDSTVSHEFSELQFQIHRSQISSYIEVVTVQLVDSFMDTYSEVSYIAEETTEIFDEFTPGPCVNAVRARWDLQVHRFGNLLSECLLNSVHVLSGWNSFLSNLQESAQVSTNLLQNSGPSALSDFTNFTSRQRLGQLINDRLRTTLQTALPYMPTFEEFRASVVDNEEEVISELTMCDRLLAAAMNNEAREDLARARACP